jgi:hypothetical protein
MNSMPFDFEFGVGGESLLEARSRKMKPIFSFRGKKNILHLSSHFAPPFFSFAAAASASSLALSAT